MLRPSRAPGVIAEMVAVSMKVTPVAAMPSKVTVAPETKLPPLSVTEVPPAVVPEFGVIEFKVGGGAGP